MAFTRVIEAPQRKDRPLVTVRKNAIAFNVAFMEASFSDAKKPDRCDVLADESKRMLKLILGTEGMLLSRDGGHSKCCYLQSRKLFKQLSWLKPGRYEAHYNASEKAWLVTIS